MDNWDLSRLRKMAGIQEAAKVPAKPLMEAGWRKEDDNDDEDRDAKIASSDKRQKAFEKRNKKTLDDVKDEGKNVAKEEVKKAEDKKSERSEEAHADKKKEEVQADDKQEEVKAEAKRRGKAPNPNSFSQWAIVNAKKYEHDRKGFFAAAREKFGADKSAHHISSAYARNNPKSTRSLKEAKTLFSIIHPFLKGFALAENRELNQMQWIDESSPLDPMFFVTEAEAKKVAKYMAEWKNQSGIVTEFNFDEDAAE